MWIGGGLAGMRARWSQSGVTGVRGTDSRTVRKQVYENGSPASNLREPRILDVSVDDHWNSLESDVDELKTSLPAFEGVVMCE